MASFRHILTATDFSDASRGAIDLAVSMARDSGAELTVMHVCEIPAYPEFGFTLDLVTPVADLAKAKLDALVSQLRPACPGITSVVKIGAPWEQILTVADESGADLVVVGTHGRRGFAHALLGSVAEHVVRLSPIPVLTVRAAPR